MVSDRLEYWRETLQNISEHLDSATITITDDPSIDDVRLPFYLAAPKPAKSPHSFEKSAHRWHETSAMRTSGDAASAPNRSISRSASTLLSSSLNASRRRQSRFLGDMHTPTMWAAACASTSARDMSAST